MTNTELKVSGMDCAEEIAILKRDISPLPGVTNLSFDLLNARMVVTHEATITQEKLIEAVKKTGMTATPFADSKELEGSRTFWDLWGRTLMTSLSAIILALGFLVHALTSSFYGAFSGEGIPLTSKVLYSLAAIFGAWFVVPKAIYSARRLSPDMNLLMTVAVIGAAIIGEWFEAATVSFLFSVSLALESWSVSRARNAVASLMELSPQTARILKSHGSEETVNADKVEVGAHFLVKPGEKVPLDGKVLKGQSSINQAPITGESVPVQKGVGDEIFAGTINENGALEVEVLKPASQSTLSQIIKLVQDAQAKRSPSEQWVEKFARYYTPLILLAAILIGIVPPIFGAEWSKWFYEALVLLVIGCPCALVISTPVSIVAALTCAAKNGILIKGGLYVEVPARIKAIALDKTGTLTKGKLLVQDLIPLSGHTEKELLEIASAIESRSEHPIARAIVARGKKDNVRSRSVDGYTAIKGKGAEALLDGRKVWVGSHKYLEERGEETPEMHQKLEELSSDGKTVVVIGEEGHVCGFISLSDEIRLEAKDVVSKLKERGVERVIMLTGDNRPTGDAIGKLTGVDEVRAELLPQDKIRAIEELVSKYGIVAMVGDGVNDAPALARASLGIAMGAAGSDAALETADIALMRDDLTALPWLIDHSRRALSIIRQNISLALGVKGVFVVLTFLGHASLWGAIAADMGVSLFVVANALRLLR